MKIISWNVAGLRACLKKGFEDFFNNEKPEIICLQETKLLDKAVKLLKKGETMVYSTCSILERENENIVNKFIKTGKMEIVPFDENMYKDIEKLPCNLKGAICVMPNENYEGFFAVKLRKK